MMNREKVIQEFKYETQTGYFLKDDFILHSFDDEPASIYGNINSPYSKTWYKDGLAHRDNNLPAVIYSDSDVDYYKNGKRYWFIINKEYYDIKEIKEKFKNKILKLNVVISETVLKEHGIDYIWLRYNYYLILDQSQYNLAILKFL